MLTGSLDQCAVKFWVSFVRPNWCGNALETEARNAHVPGLNLHCTLRSYFIIFRRSSEFSIELSKLNSNNETFFPYSGIENFVESRRYFRSLADGCLSLPPQGFGLWRQPRSPRVERNKHREPMANSWIDVNLTALQS